ncbi:amino acid ABC transporter permease [Pseudochelatococcus sp. B33]
MFEFFLRYWHSYLAGLGVSFVIATVSMMVSILLGTMLATSRLGQNAALRASAAIYIALFRAVPPLLVLYVVFFGIPVWARDSDIPGVAALFDPLNNRIVAAVVAMSLTSAAYSAEIIRAGIVGVPADQIEAARSIGMPFWLRFRRVIAPQAFRLALPPLGNEYVYVLKGTSLVSVIGVVELTRSAQLAAGSTFEYLTAYTLAGLYYIFTVAMLQIALGYIDGSRRRREHG